MVNTRRSHTEAQRLGEINNEIKFILNSIPALIEKTFPIPQKFRNKLPSDINELSHLLTNNRGNRSLSYLSRPNYLSAYLYYFLPWNLYRLCLLLPTLELTFSPGDIITDLGCGPLTFTSALWITYPALRDVPLEFNCIDRSSPALEAGKIFFTSLCQTNGNKNLNNDVWKINLIKEDIDFRKDTLAVSGKKIKKSSFVCAINIFNEIYEKLPHNNTEGLRRMAANIAKLMHGEASAQGSILTVEPGIPQSGRFISFLRSAFLELNRPPASPCTHCEICPFINGSAKTLRGRNWIDTKKRWCHFAYETYDAPNDLRRLSAAAKLPKDRLVLSYLFTGKTQKNFSHKHEETNKARVISDAFALPNNRYGRYGCSSQGLVLLTGDKNHIENTNSGSIVKIIYNTNKQQDIKSGALIVNLEVK